jgi:hypothetical protein
MFVNECILYRWAHKVRDKFLPDNMAFQAPDAALPWAVRLLRNFSLLHGLIRVMAMM